MNNIVIVGSGFSGSYIARELAEKDYKVKVIEQRNHIAGNMFDKIDSKTQTLVHEYGPHIFHTDNEDVMAWLNKFSDWQTYYNKTSVYIDGQFYKCSFGFHTIDALFNLNEAVYIKNKLLELFPNRKSVSIVELLKVDDKLIKEFSNFLWEKDYKLYTSKQWGIPPEKVDPNVLKRVPIYLSYYDKYFSNKYEGIPINGYTQLFNNILNHNNIDVELNDNALNHIEIKNNKIYYDGVESIVIYTGAIDELFNYKYGKLNYRSLSFKKEYSKHKTDFEHGTAGVLVYPSHKYPYTRITNYGTFLLNRTSDEQVSVKEYSHAFEVNGKYERYYPLSTLEDKEIYSKYKGLSDSIDGLYLSGRLADYKYYDMDKAIEAAMNKFNVIIKDLEKH